MWHNKMYENAHWITQKDFFCSDLCIVGWKEETVTNVKTSQTFDERLSRR